MYADFGTLPNISVYFVTVMKIPMACNFIFLFRVSVTQSLSFLVLVLLSLVRLHMMFISFRYYRILSSLSRDKKLMVQHNIHMYVYLCYFIVVYVLFCGFFFSFWCLNRHGPLMWKCTTVINKISKLSMFHTLRWRYGICCFKSSKTWLKIDKICWKILLLSKL